ncbi:MAG: TRAP transporter substrate-binding protein [Bacillota bacterium]
MKKRRSLLVVILALAIMALVLMGCSSSSNEPAPSGEKTGTDDKIPTFRIATWSAPTAPTNVVLTEMVNKLKEKLKGKVNIEYYEAGSLYVDVDMPDVIPRGLVDAGFVTLGQLVSLAPSTTVSETPLSFTSEDHLYRVLDSGLHDIINSEIEDDGMILLGEYSLGPPPVVTIKDAVLHIPADFKGLTIRSATENSSAWLKALGASPTFISYEEQYMALQRGTVEGSSGGLMGMEGQKLWEVVNNMLVPQGVSGEYMMGFVGSKERIDNLPPDVRDTILAAFKEWTVKAREANSTSYKIQVAEFENNGVKVTYPEKVEEEWYPILKPLGDDMRAKWGPNKAKIEQIIEQTKD